MQHHSFLRNLLLLTTDLAEVLLKVYGGEKEELFCQILGIKQ